MTEKEKKSDMRLQFLLVLILGLLAFCGGYDVAKHHFEDKNGVVDTLIVEHWDTAFIDRPTEVVRYIVRHDTVEVGGSEAQIIVINDSTAVVPISQAVYQDSTEKARYTAFVSGYHAALDSIRIECLSTTTTITKWEKERRWGLGAQIGFGVSTKGVAPYAGVGVYYRLW